MLDHEAYFKCVLFKKWVLEYLPMSDYINSSSTILLVSIFYEVLQIFQKQLTGGRISSIPEIIWSSSQINLKWQNDVFSKSSSVSNFEKYLYISLLFV